MSSDTLVDDQNLFLVGLNLAEILSDQEHHDCINLLSGNFIKDINYSLYNFL